MKIGRNDPCHCGSGKKYKRCHLDEDAALELSSAPPVRKAASDLARYAEILVQATDGSEESTIRALEMAMVFWEAAERPAEERERFLVEAEGTLQTDNERREFRGLAELMIQRHEAMFPEAHARRDGRTDTVP